jgi:hypothetical protein
MAGKGKGRVRVAAAHERRIEHVTRYAYLPLRVMSGQWAGVIQQFGTKGWILFVHSTLLTPHLSSINDATNKQEAENK